MQPEIDINSTSRSRDHAAYMREWRKNHPGASRKYKGKFYSMQEIRDMRNEEIFKALNKFLSQKWEFTGPELNYYPISVEKVLIGEF